MNTTPKHSATPWHVNASKAGRIIGDETVAGWDKLTINGPNMTVATVYRGPDARLIVRAVNAHDDMLEACRKAMKAYTNAANGIAFAERFPAGEIRAAIAKAEGRG
jgi:hypothetical protein